MTSWINDTRAVISQDELAKDVNGAEALLERHAEHKSEIDAREDSFRATAEAGQMLLDSGNYYFWNTFGDTIGDTFRDTFGDIFGLIFGDNFRDTLGDNLVAGEDKEEESKELLEKKEGKTFGDIWGTILGTIW